MTGNKPGFKILPADMVVIAYLMITAVLMIFIPKEEFDVGMHLIDRLLIIPGIAFIVFLDSEWRNNFTKFLHLFYPLTLLSYIYGETALLNHIFFTANLDPLFINLDNKIFGFQPALVFSKAFPQVWFSEFMNLGYFSYYFMTIGVSVIIYFTHRPFAEKAVFVIVTSFLIYYLFFIIFPVVGPQYFFEPPRSEVPVTGFFSKAVKAVQKAGEHPTGAFPSSHVGMALIFLYLSAKTNRLMFWVLLSFVTLILFATVYIKAHYAVDIIGGILSAPVILSLSLRIWHFLLNYLGS